MASMPSSLLIPPRPSASHRRPHARTLAVTGASLLALTVSGCTGEDSEPTTQDAPSTTEAAGITQGDRVWFCGLINDTYVDTLTDGLGSTARQDELRDDATGWVCEIKVTPEGGEEQVAVRMSITPVADIDEIRPAYAEAEGVEEGDDALGEVYLAPGKAVAMMPCEAPSSSQFAGEDVPYAFEFEALLDPGTEMTGELEDGLRRMYRAIDQQSGCSPSVLRGQTQPAPSVDESEQTSPGA